MLRWVARVGREPLFQFIAIGGLLWAGFAYWSASDARYTIHVGAVERERAALNYLRQYGQPPTAEQLRALLDRYVREEIFVREGRALRLDEDDEIVRRRIVQKYEFLQTDLAVADVPTPEALQKWFQLHQQLYLTPRRISFSQVYFSVDRDGDEGAKARTVAALRALRTPHATRGAGLGDIFPGPAEVTALAPDEIERVFGSSQLSDQVFKLPLAQWSGPYRSGYGWHLVYVTSTMPASLPPFAQVRERVLADYQDYRRRLLNARAFESLRARYTVRYDGPGGLVTATNPTPAPELSSEDD